MSTQPQQVKTTGQAQTYTIIAVKTLMIEFFILILLHGCDDFMCDAICMVTSLDLFR